MRTVITNVVILLSSYVFKTYSQYKYHVLWSSHLGTKMYISPTSITILTEFFCLSEPWVDHYLTVVNITLKISI